MSDPVLPGEGPKPMTGEQIARLAELIEMHRQYGPALSIEGEAQLLVEVLRLRELKCAVCGMRVAHLNHAGHVIGWGCADGNECKPDPASGMPHAPAQIDGDGLGADSGSTGGLKPENPAQAADRAEALREAAASLQAIADHATRSSDDWRDGVRYAATLLARTADDEAAR